MEREEIEDRNRLIDHTMRRAKAKLDGRGVRGRLAVQGCKLRVNGTLISASGLSNACRTWIAGMYQDGKESARITDHFASGLETGTGPCSF